MKVTGGGTRRGAVAAHFAYISRRGRLEIETDEGERIGRPEEQKRLLDEWHLELTAGQYRRQKRRRSERGGRRNSCTTSCLSMPAPTPPDKVLAAARQFARQKFAQHRYAMVLHTDQQHPHVHLVVKAENELGRRLHIDKQLLRDWREDFAQLMREQGIAANATPRAIRGENKKNRREGIFKAQRYGKSTAMRDRVIGIAKSCHAPEPSRIRRATRLIETRKSLVSAWMKAAEVLDAQGEDDPGGRCPLLRQAPAARPHRPATACGAIPPIQGTATPGRTARPRARQSEGPGADSVGQRAVSGRSAEPFRESLGVRFDTWRAGRSARRLPSDRRDLLRTAFDVEQQRRPGFQRRAALVEIIVRVVGALDSAQLVTQTALGHFAADAEGRQVRSHGATQVVQGEVFQSVLDRRQAPRSRCRYPHAAPAGAGRAGAWGTRTRYRLPPRAAI